jgi:hypothetical protein
MANNMSVGGSTNLTIFVNAVSAVPIIHPKNLGEWAIAMDGRYESHILFILFTHICHIHFMTFLFYFLPFTLYLKHFKKKYQINLH